MRISKASSGPVVLQWQQQPAGQSDSSSSSNSAPSAAVAAAATHALICRFESREELAVFCKSSGSVGVGGSVGGTLALVRCVVAVEPGQDSKPGVAF